MEYILCHFMSESLLCLLILKDVTRQYFVLSLRRDFGYLNNVLAVEDYEVRFKAFSFLFVYSLYFSLIQYSLTTASTLSKLPSPQHSHWPRSTVPLIPFRKSRAPMNVNEHHD